MIITLICPDCGKDQIREVLAGMKDISCGYCNKVVTL